MPNYDYSCDNCGEVKEISHPMSESRDNHACPDCDTGLLHKVFSAVPGHFKGQGWGKIYRNYTPKETS